MPLAQDGRLSFRLHESDEIAAHSGQSEPLRAVRIERVQLEQDTGKTLIGDDVPTTQPDGGDGTSDGEAQMRRTKLIDLNRAGCALIEIVSAPGTFHKHEKFVEFCFHSFFGVKSGAIESFSFFLHFFLFFLLI